ncbi:hypothetical protein [Nocardia sp. BMG111209]|uniref:TPR repeat region-containing protein n=1 Tax=Nocardia sp. BMG111209 TaxID=1160137 RepID=UPI00037366EA|nr:hypothetical protein [Nocardia sp. BMG111209]
MTAVAADAAKLRDIIDTHADTMNRTIHGLDWSGDAARAAGDRADREKAQQRAVATAYDDLSNALQGAENDTGWLIGQIQQTVRNLPPGWSVAEDFTVTAPAAADKNTAANDTASLQSLAAQLGRAMDTWAPTIAAAVQAISTTAPITKAKITDNPADKFRARQAQADLRAIRNGTADAATLERVRLATTLSQPEKDALAGGESANIPQFEYLQALSQGLNGLSGNDIATLGSTLTGSGHDQVQAAVADTFRIVSDPQVHSAGIDGGPGGLTGGMKQLPDTVQRALMANPIASSRFGPGVVNNWDDLLGINTVMSNGDKSIQGSDINRAMIKQGAELAAATRPGHHPDVNNPGLLPALTNGLLENASGDRIAIHDAIIADPNGPAGTDPHSAADRMNAICDNGGKYYGNKHVLGILQHPWNPDQHGAEHLFRWIGEDADAQSKGTFANNQAGQTAYALAGILADPNNQQGLNSPANPLGVGNPGLTRTLANVMSPYLGNFAGVTDDAGPGLLNSAPVDSTGHPLKLPFEDAGRLSNLFSVLDSDPEAARTINSAGLQWHDAIAYARGLDPANAPALLANSSSLQQAMNTGLVNQINAHAAERSFQAAQDYADKGVFADGVTSAVQTVAAFGPGPTGPVIGGIAATADSYIKADVIPNPADPAHPLADDKVSTELNSIRSTIQVDNLRDEYLQVQGYIQRDPSAAHYFDRPGHGSLLDWHNITADGASSMNAWRNAYAQFSHDTNADLHSNVFPAQDRTDTEITESALAPRSGQTPPEATK